MKHLSKTLSIVFCLGIANSIIAGEARLSGTGSVQADPDCVSLSITVNAACYPSPSLASKAADAAAANIYDFLQKTVHQTRDTVSSNGGYTQPYERYISGKSVCMGTFQKTAVIRVNVRSISDFVKYFDQIQEKVFAEFKMQVQNDENAPITSVTLGAPNPEFFPEHLRALSMQARTQAVHNAIEIFRASRPTMCQINRYDIVEISDPVSRSNGGYGGGTAASPTSGGSQSAPISFGQQTVTEDVMVKINFEGGHCQPVDSCL